MIRKTTAYTASDGTMHESVLDAQKCDLAALIHEAATANAFEHWVMDDAVTMSSWLLNNKATALIDILTTGPRSRPTTRKKAGTANPKRAARAATPEQVKAGFRAMRKAASDNSESQADSDAHNNALEAMQQP